ncbi:MAG: diguanylate cyclase [Candidatus Thiodiazotropha taylori]
MYWTYIEERITSVANIFFNKNIFLGALSLGFVFFAFGQFGLMIQSSQSGLTLIWPASGIALAILYLSRISIWPGVILGMMLLAFHNNIPMEVALYAAIGSVCEALVAIHLFRRYTEETIDRLEGLLAFVFFCVFLGPVFSASIGTYAFHKYLEIQSEPFVTWLYWWLGNSIGIITFGGTLIALATNKGKRSYRVELFDIYKTVRIVLFFIVIAISLNSSVYPDEPFSMVLLFFLLPVVAVIALLGGINSAAMVNLTVATIFIVGGYLFSLEHFSTHHIGHLYLHVAFIGILSFTSLSLAAIGNEMSEKEIFHYKSSHDSLTGLVNREYLRQQLKSAIHTVTSPKSEQQHALLFIDLDKFKSINDTVGHIGGDRMLQQLSELLKKHIRQRDCAARWGGDEFVVLLWYCPVDQALHIAETIRKEIEEYTLVVEANRYQVTASIGLTMLDRETHTVDAALDRADKASYISKAKGGNVITTN